jgi:YD repeat-containing protein
VGGRLTNSVDTQYTYDAAGRDINVVGQGGDLTQTQVFDGDGVRAMLSSQQVTPTEDETTTETKTQYFITSSVLNQVVTELDQSGAKTRTFVYQGSQILAWQQQSGTTQTMAWEHRDVSNARDQYFTGLYSHLFCYQCSIKRQDKIVWISRVHSTTLCCVRSAGSAI